MKMMEWYDCGGGVMKLFQKQHVYTQEMRYYNFQRNQRISDCVRRALKLTKTIEKVG